jgi:hypothetical protein
MDTTYGTVFDSVRSVYGTVGIEGMRRYIYMYVCPSSVGCGCVQSVLYSSSSSRAPEKDSKSI